MKNCCTAKEFFLPIKLKISKLMNINRTLGRKGAKVPDKGPS